MRVLLDEDIPISLRHYFQTEVVVETVEYRGWKGLQNGALLRSSPRPFRCSCNAASQVRKP